MRMRKVLIIIAAVIAALLVIAGILTISYTSSDDFTSDTFPEGTMINGVNCSGLDYDRAADEIGDAWNSKTVVVQGKLGEKLDSYTDFGCTYDIKDQLEKVKADHLISAAINHYIHIPFDARIAMKVAKCDKDFAENVKNSEFLSYSTIVKTQDAYVDLEEPGFPIVPEVYGNEVNADAYLDDILVAVSTGNFLFQFDEDAYRTMPEVKSDDRELAEYQKFCRKYLNQKISYQLGTESFTLSAAQLRELMKDDLSGNPDQNAVWEFADKLKQDYDVEEKEFTSLTGKTFKVSGGGAGWLIDVDGEAAQLSADISSHEDINREPVYLQKGTGEYSKTLDLGDTYIDVDISRQQVVYFENEKKKLETDCVTGCWAAGHSTPTGVYDVWSKNRNIILRGGGKKKDPGYYESFVSYWMPFLGNSYGLHDASWRSSFGGEIYRYSGSHGCVNLPPPKAAELYNMISIGTTVIIHY
ncbi:MAG: L,D-transpeptidase family protein [Eubacteriales bacterium]|nr:L,D-transpeptidase family protein [Eubacteriales bacterium]